MPLGGAELAQLLQCLAEGRFDHRPGLARVGSGRITLGHDARQSQQPAQVVRRCLTEGRRETVEFLPVQFEHGRVKPIPERGSNPVDPQQHVDGTASDRLAHDPLDLSFQGLKAFGRLHHDFEMAVVDRTDFDGNAQAFILAAKIAKARHAQQQGRPPSAQKLTSPSPGKLPGHHRPAFKR